MSEPNGSQHHNQNQSESKPQDSMMRNLPGKYAEGVAKEAGEQTAEYVADNMQQNMQQNMDDMKEQARVCTDL